MKKTSWCAAVVVALLGSTALGADTLILRDGRRVDGELIAVTGATVEFRDARGRSRIVRIDREEVRAIELDSTVLAGGISAAPVRPRGLREKDLIVSGDVPFIDTGIDVRPGQHVYFEAAGNVWWKRNQKTGPAGETRSDRERDARRPMPHRPLAALIGKVGHESADLFFIGGDPGPIRMQSAGRLFLGVNDDYFEDNHGNFLVVVYY